MRQAAVTTALLVLALGAVRAPAGEPRVTAISPARMGDLLVARLSTAGLPGDRLLQSMRSGLVSAVELELALLDEQRQVLGAARVDLQLGFDLWEEVFSVRDAGVEHRFRSLQDLQGFLGELEAIPVAAIEALQPEGRYRLRVGLQLHAIAPAQKEQVEDAIVGDPRSRREGQDRQEASVSLGRLIRLFYKGGERRDGVRESLSGWFMRKELPDAAH